MNFNSVSGPRAPKNCSVQLLLGCCLSQVALFMPVMLSCFNAGWSVGVFGIGLLFAGGERDVVIFCVAGFVSGSGLAGALWFSGFFIAGLPLGMFELAMVFSATGWVNAGC